MAESTPLMEQYAAIKAEHRDAVLFFRLGDFYEMFQDDAAEVSSLLNLTLTHRNGEPMCGIPYHASSVYIARLLKLGKKIAICEQISLNGKGLADRKVVEVITPGTVVDEGYLDQTRNNYLAALGSFKGIASLSYLDLSTGDFAVRSFPSSELGHELKSELFRLGPREILIQQSLLDDYPVVDEVLSRQSDLVVNRFPDWCFDIAGSYEKARRILNVANLKGFGLQETSPELYSVGVLLDYVAETAKSLLPHVSSIQRYIAGDFLWIDEPSLRNLEIVQNLHDGSRKFTLLETLDYTRTAMGSRALRKWLLNPLRSKAAIEERLEGVGRLYHDQSLLSELRDRLGRVLDLERLGARLALDRAHAKDLLGIKESLESLAEIERLLEGFTPSDCFWTDDGSDRERIAAIVDLIERGIHPDPSVLLTEGRLIRPGFDAALDRLRELKENSHAVLESYLEEEKAATGISNLRIKYNRIIGYFFEASKGSASQVPSRFVRRQTLVNGERYTTDRLSDFESEINSASERIVELEKKLFIELRDSVKAGVPVLLKVCRAIERIDCLASFAYAATVRGYSRPEIAEDGRFSYLEGRHPVVEAHLPQGSFVPNDFELDSGSVSFALITGPNMAGKSTFLRQTALIAIMAQAGSFVPVREARIGIVDRVFCRVGAQDDLARGESTFLLEMNETANILNSATPKSLVIMDEVGRGTSTNDGLAIAWAVSEYLLNSIGAKTLFATHYHELTQLRHERIVDLTLDVLEKKGEIVFLKKVKPGFAANSYGIHVAKLAGVPPAVIERARDILDMLQGKEKSLPATVTKPQVRAQIELFSPAESVRDEIASIDVDALTPLEALNRIAAWKRLLAR
jgi:DNA mismatch repair protein MutS